MTREFCLTDHQREIISLALAFLSKNLDEAGRQFENERERGKPYKLLNVGLDDRVILPTEQQVQETAERFQEVQCPLALGESIEINRERYHGVPVMRGHRFPVANLLAEIAAADSVSEVIDDFDFEEGEVLAVIHDLCQFFDRQFVGPPVGEKCRGG